MTWQKQARGGEGGYYYRSVRTPAGPRRVYLGNGALAWDGSAADEERAEFNRAAKLVAHERNGLTDRFDATADSAGAVFRLRMLGAGFHQHRGEWRKRRGDDMDHAAEAAIEQVWKNLVDMNEELKGHSFRRHAALFYTDAALKKYPQFWNRLTSAQAAVEAEMAAAISKGDNLLAKKAVRDLGLLKESFPLREPGCPLGKLLVDQVALAELATRLALQRATRSSDAPKVVRANQRFYDAANRNLARAVAAYQAYVGRGKRRKQAAKEPDGGEPK